MRSLARRDTEVPQNAGEAVCSRHAVADPAIVERLAVIDGDVNVMTPEAFDKLIKDELVRWKRLLKPSEAAKP